MFGYNVGFSVESLVGSFALDYSWGVDVGSYLRFRVG